MFSTGLLSTAHAGEAGVIKGNKDPFVIAYAADTKHDLNVCGILTLARRAPEGFSLLPADRAGTTEPRAFRKLLAIDAWEDGAEKDVCVDRAVVEHVVLEPVVVRADTGDGLAERLGEVTLLDRGNDAIGIGAGQLAGESGSLVEDPRGAVVVVVEAGVGKDLGFDADLGGRGCGGGADDG